MKTPKTSLTLFAEQKIRRVWDEKVEKWYFSVVDVVAALTQSIDSTAYWRKLKQRLRAEGGNETVTNCHGLKMLAADGKMRLTDVADTETILRLIQSIPSPKAEPFKLWLARVGYERVEEVQDPELAIQRALKHYRALGYSDGWINQRLKSIEIRKELTSEWERVGVKEGLEYALLTDEISKAWAGMSTKEYKQYKDLKKENLRDNLTNLELVLTMLSEAATTEISGAKNPKTLNESKQVAHQGGEVAKAARDQLELQTGSSVISPQKRLDQTKQEEIEG